MEAGEELFTYHESLLGDQIRLLDIHPGAKKATICCDLVTVQRDSKEPYKALSYVWGDPARPCAITVNQKCFWITLSLQEALCHIREEVHHIKLWVDALCINQEDIGERSAQVQQMGMTYSQCNEVLIWLGTCSSELNPLESICEFHRQRRGLHSDTDEDFITRLRPGYDVFLRPWFQRLWIFQEAVLAGKGTFVLGKWRCDLDEFLAFRFTPKLLTFNLARVDPAAYAPTGGSVAMMNAFSIGVYRRLRSIDIHSNLRPTAQGTLIGACRKRKCLDPRDHIFGLVGVAEQLQVNHEVVDYRASVAEVFKTAFANVVARNVNAVAAYETVDGGSLASELPSWVPDFSLEPTTISLDAFMYGAGESRKHGLGWRENPFSIDGALLRFQGFEYGNVINLGRTSHTGDQPWCVKEWETIEERFVATSPESSPYGDCAGRREAFWRTVVADRYVGNEWPHNDETRDYELFLTHAAPVDGLYDDEYFSEDVSPWKHELRKALGAAYDNRNLFITSKKSFGLGPRRTEKGDRVVVALGLRTPILLRPGEIHGRYRMVGPAYVHGIMGGEFIDHLVETQTLDAAQIFEVE